MNDIDTKPWRKQMHMGAQGLKIAVVCDWLVTYAGAERVLEQILQIFPQADVFGVVDFLPEALRGCIQHKEVKTSFIQHLPMARNHYRRYLPLMPLAIEQLDLRGYDLVISSSHCVAKGVLTGPDQLHISYVHSPVRYAWDLQHQYLEEAGYRGLKGWLAKLVLHYMRMWDVRTANGVDCFLANSQYIAKRIWKVYHRKATVIYPPVDVDAFPLREDKATYYLTLSRLVPYKQVSRIVEAFRGMPDKELVVIGDGPDDARIKAIASENVTLLGYQPVEVVCRYMQQAKAFIFAAEEDFGIAPVEAQACGTPVIAYGKGGVWESVRALEDDHPTGLFFYQQTAEAIRDAVQQFEREGERISALDCRRNAERFSSLRFRREMGAFIQSVVEGVSDARHH